MESWPVPLNQILESNKNTHFLFLTSKLLLSPDKKKIRNGGKMLMILDRF